MVFRFTRRKLILSNYLTKLNLDAELNQVTRDIQEGELLEALERCLAIVQQQPGLGRGWHLLGVIYTAAGRREQAIAAYQKALQCDPNQAETHNNLAIVFAQSSRLPEALEHYQQAIALAPDYTQSYYNLAKTYKALGNPEAAICHYQKALALNPEYTEAWQNLGNLYLEQSEVAAAITHYQHALKLNPQLIHLHAQLASLLHQQNQIDEAIHHYQAALIHYPQSFQLHHDLGVALGACKQTDSAINYYYRALHLHPNSPEAHNNLGVALSHQEELEAAIAEYHLALALSPQYPDAYNNLAVALDKIGEYEEAIRHYRTCIALKPDYPEAHTNLGIALLLAGDFSQGWAEYEWRYQWQASAHHHSVYQPRWNGDSFTEYTLLIYSEQGFGDSIQFLRYLPFVVERGGKILMECPQPLMRLFAPFVGEVTLIPRHQPIPDFDVWVCLMSLPYILGTTLETIPAVIPYLQATTEPPVVLPHSDRLKVGLVWGGNPHHGNDAQRSCRLADWLPLISLDGVEFYSLQKGDRTQELAGIDGITNLDPYLQDFADTAAIIAQLDLIITVDTSIVHLAGAMGKPTWLLLSFVPDWRWMLEREDTPWYPTVRLFRQTTRGNWQEVIAQVKVALTHYRSPAPPSAPSPLLPSLPTAGIGITWQLGNRTGWGIYGLNLALQLLKQPDCFPHLLIPPGDIHQLHPLHHLALQPVLQAQPQWQRLLHQSIHQLWSCDFPILHALGNGFRRSPFLERLHSEHSVGIVFFEDTALSPEAIAQAHRYHRIITGSTWNTEVLLSYGITQVTLVLQGIDPTLFHPAPKLGIWGDRFVLFAGGKLEYRKGQDQIIAAFKAFHYRYPDALLLTAWQNLWPNFMLSMDSTGNVEGLPQINPQGTLEIIPWLVKNNISPEAAIDLGSLPNHLMPSLLREADVALFTSRCEGGTNLAAMECLACGIPTILSANTGHLDLIQRGGCYPLKHQFPVPSHPHFRGTEGWGNSDIEEILETLEFIYHHREQARQQATLAAQQMTALTWEKQVHQLQKALR